jgi:hypothetical protein
MSDDLISRSKLTRAMFQYVKGKKTIGQIIDEQPTAYDVDKVIEKLKKYDRICAECVRDECSDFCEIKERLDIIKRGGIE